MLSMPGWCLWFRCFYDVSVDIDLWHAPENYRGIFRCMLFGRLGVSSLTGCRGRGCAAGQGLGFNLVITRGLFATCALFIL